MQWQVIVALIVVIPVILFPVLFIWYLNIGGIFATVRERQAAHEQRKKAAPEARQHVAVATNRESVKR